MKGVPRDSGVYDAGFGEHVVVLVLDPEEARAVAFGLDANDTARRDILQWANEAERLTAQEAVW